MSRIKKDRTPELGIIGKIKIGEKVINGKGKEVPTSLDYFRFTDPTGGRYSKLAEDTFGKPKHLQVMFASNNLNHNCIERLELRNAKGQLVAYTDLETLFVSQTNGFEAVSSERINAAGGIEACMKALENKYNTKFYECLTLRVMLLGFPVLGQWEIFTKASKSSIKQIIDTYDMVMKQSGRIAWIPFTLSVQKVVSNREIPGENYKRSYSVINLHPDLSVEMQEMLLQFGDDIKGLVTPEKIKGLTSRNNQGLASGEVQTSDYEEIEEII
jgi:hypothetical protein